MTISNHKVNKNTLIVKFFSGSTGYAANNDESIEEVCVTKKIYDNFYIENLIPRSEYQYSWVTASAASDGRAEMAGYATSENWLEGNQTLSGSRVQKDGAYPMIQDNLGMNLWDRTYGLTQYNEHPSIPADRQYPIYDFLLNENQFQGNIYERQADNFTFRSAYDPLLNDEVINEVHGMQIGAMFLYALNGPYGWPIWKQIRAADGPAFRYMNRSACYNVIPQSRSFVDSNGKSYTEKVNPNQETYCETGVEMSGLPLIHGVNQKIGVMNNAQIISNPRFYEYDFSSRMSYFANKEMQARYSPDVIMPEDYVDLVSRYKSNNVTDVSGFISIDYSHVIWPKAKNYNRKVARDLEGFEFNWNDDRNERREGIVGGYYHPSKWCLDGRSSLTDPILIDGADRNVLLTTSSNVYESYGDKGILNTVENFFHNGSPFGIKTSPSMTWMGNTDPNNEGIFWTGDTPFSIPAQTGFAPFADSYEDWADHPRAIGQGMSKLAEFRISEHVRDIITQQGGNFLSDIDSFLTSTGSNSLSSDEFYETFATSEILKDFAKIRKDHKGIASPSRFELTAEAVMKFTPYEGFYPAERSVQLAELFSQSYAPSVSYTSSLEGAARDDSGLSSDVKFRNLMTPYFSPGILYNSIKAGLAVDFPVIKKKYTSFPFSTYNDYDFYSSTYGNAVVEASSAYENLGESYFKRLSFDSLISPEVELSGHALLDVHTHPSSSINVTASLGSTDGVYSMAMSNYLAEVPSFFLKGNAMSSLISAQDIDQDKYVMELGKTYKMRFIVRGCDEYDDAKNIEKAIDLGKRYNDEHLSSALTDTAQNSIIFSCLGSMVSQSYGKNYENFSRPYFDFQSFSSLYSPTYENFTGSYDHTGTAYGPGMTPSGWSIFLRGPETATSFEPTAEVSLYTPAYNEGYAYVDYEFKPYDENGNLENSSRKRRFSINEIVSNLTSSYYRAGRRLGGYIVNNATEFFGFAELPPPDEAPVDFFLSGSSHYARMSHELYHEMQLGSSFNLFDVVKNKNVSYDENGVVKSISDNIDAGDRLCIYPKWEVPIFDYSEAQKELPVSGSNNMARGVWSDWGQDLTGSNGLFMQITDVPSAKWSGPCVYGVLGEAEETPWQPVLSDGNTGSLADVIGMSKEPVRLGVVSDSKKISEAIVAVPYLDTPAGKKFIRMDKQLIDSIKDGTAVNPKQSVVDLVKSMQKYVIPPKFNFYKYDGKDGKASVDPVVMYFLEFEYEFDRDDMKRMWHNVSPKSIVKEATAKIGHELIPGELMSAIIDDSMKWMVFKVKQKGEWNYYNKTLSAKDDDKFRFDFTKTGKYVEPEYSYNWPYDYMSIIDRAKISATVKVETTEAMENRRGQFNVEDLSTLVPPTPIENIRNFADQPIADQFNRSFTQNAPEVPLLVIDPILILDTAIPMMVTPKRDLNPFKSTSDAVIEATPGKITPSSQAQKVVESVMSNRTKTTKTKIR